MLFFPTLITHADEICPPGLCWDPNLEWCDICDEGGGGGQSASASFAYPAQTSGTLSFNGNQVVDYTVKNNNILGVLLTTNSNPNIYPGGWSVALYPGQSSTKVYSILKNVPIGWVFTVTTGSDAANVSMSATWNSW